MARKTIQVEDDVHRKIKQFARKTGRTVKGTVQYAISLAIQHEHATTPARDVPSPASSSGLPTRAASAVSRKRLQAL